MGNPSVFMLLLLATHGSAGVVNDQNEDANGLMKNEISLTQEVNTNKGGCCNEFEDILNCIKDLKKDISSILEAEVNGLKPTTITSGDTTTNSGGEATTTTEQPTTTAAECPDAEWQEWGGFCYLLSTVRKDWASASSHCQSFTGGNLASVHSAEENAFIQSLGSGKYPWFGLQKNANTKAWEWTDGTPFDYQDWASQGDDAKSCAYITLSSGKWTAYGCTVNDFFLCKLKLGGSA